MSDNNSEIRYYVDPRTIDGTPYEVAGEAVDQLITMHNDLLQAVDDASLMVRNASMERDIDLGNDPDPDGWARGGQNAILIQVGAELAANMDQLKTLRSAATWNPKHPPTASS